MMVQHIYDDALVKNINKCSKKNADKIIEEEEPIRLVGSVYVKMLKALE